MKSSKSVLCDDLTKWSSIDPEQPEKASCRYSVITIEAIGQIFVSLSVVIGSDSERQCSGFKGYTEFVEKSGLIGKTIDLSRVSPRPCHAYLPKTLDTAHWEVLECGCIMQRAGHLQWLITPPGDHCWGRYKDHCNGRRARWYARSNSIFSRPGPPRRHLGVTTCIIIFEPPDDLT